MMMNHRKNWKKAMIVRFGLWSIFAAIISISTINCGGGSQVTPTIYIPDIDHSQYNDANYIEGWQNLKEGNTRQAFKNFNKSTLGREQLLVAFGYAALIQGKPVEARSNFEKCLAINPENPQALLGLATLYDTLKETERAYQVYSRLRTTFPNDERVKNRYETIKNNETQNALKIAEKYKTDQDMNQYIRYLEIAASYSPEMTDIKTEIADFYAGRKDFEKAARQYEEILEKLPDNESILRKLADMYEKTGAFDSAIMMYKKIQEIKPGDNTLPSKINQLKSRLNEMNLPEKFKGIFFKEILSREELAALIGHYFDKYLERPQPVIITDIGNSFAKEYIIRICALDIMSLRPDHSFDRFTTVNRATFAVVMNALLKYLEKSGRELYSVRFTPLENPITPGDISSLHKNYEIIKFLLNAGIIKLDSGNNFNPTRDITPSEVLVALQKILNSIHPIK